MSTRKVAPPDPSAQWLLNQFSESAQTNQIFIEGLNQTRKQTQHPETRSHTNARLRQALMLITGCACDTALFLDVKTGNLLSAFRINIMLKDLVQAHRMDHGKYNAFFKKVFRTMEDLMQKSTSVYHASVALIAIAAVFFTYLEAGKTINLINRNTDMNIDSSIKIKLGFAGILGSLPEISNTTRPLNIFRRIWLSTQRSVTAWRSAQLVSAVFKDGISASKLDKMKKMSRELERLDHEIQSLDINEHSANYILLDKLERFRSQTKSFWNLLSFGTIQNDNHKVYALFKDALKHPHKYTRAPFLKRLIDINGSQNVLAYHFLNSYGDRRNNVQEIIAAYLIMREKTQHSEQILKEKLIPTVANSSSIHQAKQKQQNTRKSSLRKSRVKTHKKTNWVDDINQIIRSNKVVIFSKTHCPYCLKAKIFLRAKYTNRTITIIELDTIQNGDSLQEQLYKKTKQQTVPNIFINQKHIGGFSDLSSINNRK